MSERDLIIASSELHITGWLLDGTKGRQRPKSSEIRRQSEFLVSKSPETDFLDELPCITGAWHFSVAQRGSLPTANQRATLQCAQWDAQNSAPVASCSRQFTVLSELNFKGEFLLFY